MNQGDCWSNLSVAILAGGKGTRLRPAVSDCPKPLAPVGGRPFITHLLDQLSREHCPRAVLLTGYRASQVQQTLGLAHRDLALDYSPEIMPFGTGGALRHALGQLPGRTILLMNGDSYCDVDLSRLISDHRRHRAELTMVLAEVADASRFGAVQCKCEGRVSRFVEKQAGIGAALINAGIYLLERSLVETIPTQQMISLERECFPRWIESRAVFGFPCPGRFLDIGTPESYAEAEMFFQDLEERRLALTT